MQGIKAPDPGIEQRFCDLVNTYQTPLLRLCYLHLQDKGLAEDAVQETFLKAYRALLAYQVTLDENGIAAEAVELPSSGTEELPEDQLPGGDGNG